jgi:hypothetical protein
MVPPSQKNSLRRMKLEELIGKIEQIEEQVHLTLHEYPRGHTIERQRLVLAIAKQIRAHLTDQLAAGARKALAAEAEPYLRVIEGDADRVRVAVLPEVSSGSK